MNSLVPEWWQSPGGPGGEGRAIGAAGGTRRTRGWGCLSPFTPRVPYFHPPYSTDCKRITVCDTPSPCLYGITTVSVCKSLVIACVRSPGVILKIQLTESHLQPCKWDSALW